MLSARLRTLLTSPRTRGVGMVLVGALIVVAMVHSVHDWPAAFRNIEHTPGWALAGALGCLILAGIAAMRSWTAVLPHVADNSVSWARVFYVGQLGKYMPGSVWAAAIQAQLGRRLGATPRQLVTAFVVAFAGSIVCSAMVGVPAVYSRWGVGLALLAVLCSIVGAVGLMLIARWPTFVERTGMRLALSDVIRCLAWSLLGWIVAGLHLAILLTAMGAPTGRALLIAPAASALAVCVGSLAVFTPGGIGVRELVLITCLSTVVAPAQAAAAVIISRVLYLAADLSLAAATVSVRRHRKVFA